ncbi:MAG TPA: family 78 glycoside hydrolase catalytic domain [Tepidisphaeraceae bacterium]|nr:family 78 glycoside hydrolase catalytic domain [Tepidisphaeraceae bacterium]
MLKPGNLQCDFSTNPVGIDNPAPRLSWIVECGRAGARQTAYRIIVASSAAELAEGRGNLWDTGKVGSANTTAIRYAGAPILSAQRQYWCVMVWDEHDQPSGWSAPTSFTAGLLSPSDWAGAKWITDPYRLRWCRAALGYRSSSLDGPAASKWLTIDLGAVVPIESIVLHAVRHDVTEGLGFPVRFKLEGSTNLGTSEWCSIFDQSHADFPNPWAQKIRVPGNGVQARFVRLSVNRARVLDGVECLALAQIEVMSGGGNAALNKRVTASDSVEDSQWSAQSITDGLAGTRAGDAGNATLMLLRQFDLLRRPSRALLFASGLGQVDAYLNGRRISDRVLGPGWTNHRRTALYETTDVTQMLASGANAIGFVLSGGMYNIQPVRYHKLTTPFRPLCAIAQLLLEYADGSSERLVTNEQWRVVPSPTTFSSVYGGEEFDARLVDENWCMPSLVDDALTTCTGVDLPATQLRGASTAGPPCRRIEPLRAKTVTPIGKRRWIYDMGQNTSLMPRLAVTGPAGSGVRITPAELLDKDGAIDRRSCGQGSAYWQYTLGDGAAQTWEPRFFYHGARYLQVEQIPALESEALPSVISLEADVVHADVAPAGRFECSNDHLNRVHQLVRWAQRSNLVSVMSDCPHRERLGWLEQYHLHGPSLRYEFNLNRLYTKAMQDMADSQTDDGLVPCTAPEFVVFNDGFRDSPEWGSAAVLVPWQQYLWTGDDSLLERYFDVMVRYVDYLGTKASEHIVSHGLGDWYDIGPNPPGHAQLTPAALTATAFYFEDVRILSRTAAVLGKHAEAERYGALCRNISDAFNRTFYDSRAGRYASGSQTAQAIPLVMNLVAQGHRTAVIEAMLTDVRQSGLTAGDIGHRYLLRALADAGHSQAIFDLHTQTDRPGYGYILARGATALTEAWDARRESSQNHFMLGHIIEWLYHDLAGIRLDESAPGFRHVVIQPAVVGDVTRADASYESIKGKVGSSWSRRGGEFELRATIPANVTASVVVPGRSATVEPPAGVHLGAGTLEPGGTRYAVSSGNYVFRSTIA